jgi:predicted PurR-regulated permease PerM
MERHGARRAVGVTAVAIVLFGAVAAFFLFLVPPMTREVAEAARRWPQYAGRILHAVPPLPAGKFALAGLTALIFVLVVAIYLLVEGRRAFAWLASFAPKRDRARIERTARETSGVVLAYMRGNVITSVICAVYVVIVMTALHVPAPLLLAVIAFIFDFVPVVGTIVMTVPAALLALTVSPTRSLVVVGAYLAYHLIENYLIIPRVYGSQMRLSTLTVLLSVTAGGILQGAIGAVLALPVAAAYPIIERIWLRGHLPPDTVERHEEIESANDR